MDRSIRIIVGTALVTLAYTHHLGAWAWLGVVPLVTGVIRYCPAYSIFKKNGCCAGKQDGGGSCCK